MNDAQWAIAVKERDGWQCRRCGGTYAYRGGGLHAHHIFTRSRRSARHLLENGITLCAPKCHPWAHSHPRDFLAWAVDELGIEAFEALRARSREMLMDEIDHERERVLEAQFEERREARR